MSIAVRMKVDDPNPCLTLSLPAMNHTLHADLWIHMYMYCITNTWMNALSYMS
jgi:hypothetical protein